MSGRRAPVPRFKAFPTDGDVSRPARVRQTLHPLLAGLTAEGRSLVGAHLRSVQHTRGVRLATAGAPLTVVHFVTGGLVAIVNRTADGASVETGLIGDGGLIGVSAALGAHSPSLRDAVALGPVATLALDITALDHILALFPEVRRTLMAYANFRIDDAARLCACAALHSVDQRIARWLLDATAISRASAVDVTHARLSALLGVRRASVTAALHLLEGEQGVRCQRGRIEVRDAEALNGRSCGCHRRAVRQAPPFPPAHPVLSNASSTDRPRD